MSCSPGKKHAKMKMLHAQAGNPGVQPKSTGTHFTHYRDANSSIKDIMEQDRGRVPTKEEMDAQAKKDLDRLNEPNKKKHQEEIDASKHNTEYVQKNVTPILKQPGLDRTPVTPAASATPEPPAKPEKSFGEKVWGWFQNTGGMVKKAPGYNKGRTGVRNANTC